MIVATPKRIRRRATNDEATAADKFETVRDAVSAAVDRLKSGQWVLDGWRRRHKGKPSRSAEISSHGRDRYNEDENDLMAPDPRRCIVCRMPLVRSYPLAKALRLAPWEGSRGLVAALSVKPQPPGSESEAYAREWFERERDAAAAKRDAAAENMMPELSRRKRRDAKTCSPSCRTILYKLRKLPRKRQEAELLRLYTIAQRRGLLSNS